MARRLVVHADEIQERLEQKDLVVARVAPFTERRRVRGERYLRGGQRRAGGLCFGAGLGITLFGIAYMYVHDGMVHKRFPTGPLGKLPWLRRVAAAHTIHHTEQFQGAPWGLFLGEDELSKHPGGIEELDKVCLANDRADKRREMECLAAGFSNAEQCDVPIHLSVGSSKDDYLVGSQDETELGIKAGLHIPSQIESPQCVITEDGKRINES